MMILQISKVINRSLGSVCQNSNSICSCLQNRNFSDKLLLVSFDKIDTIERQVDNFSGTVRDDQGNQGSRIGYIDCLFALVKEKCIRCLFCTKIFKFSLIQKHLGQASNKDCKMAYSSDDIEAFKNESKKRRKEKELQRQRKKYDCDKRSEKHKKEYKQKQYRK